MNLELVAAAPCDLSPNLVIVGVFENQDFSDSKIDSGIVDFLINKEQFKAKFGQFYKLTPFKPGCADKILFAGLGKQEEFTLNKLREVAAKAIRQAASMKNIQNVAFSMMNIKKTDFEKADLVQVLTEGILIGDYNFDKYKSKDEDAEKIEKVTICDLCEGCADKAREGFEKGKIVATSINYAKDLINEQPNIVTPEKIAQCAKELQGADVRVYEKNEIEQMGMGAFLAVSQGGGHSPKFIHIKYTPANPKKKVAIIGKSITFDSGGLDLKPPASMLTMKDDMSGSAVVLGVIKALVALKPDVEVHGIIASTENMVGSKAYKPGDILRAKNGKTIEVDNTDAEGRLTLADALCFADELGVDEIIDIATLTGACMVALGSYASGIMGNDDKLVKKLIETGKIVGENLWEMPMFEDYKDSLKSDIADMKNTGSRYGGASTAGVFLSNFVKNTKWAHIDIAGTAFLDKPQHECSKGASGVGVRTLINYISKI